MKRFALSLLPLFAFTLAACSTVGDAASSTWHGVSDTTSSAWNGVFGDSREPLSAPAAAGPVGMAAGCPQVAVVRDLSVYQNPPLADEGSVVLSARMGKIRGGCSLTSEGLGVNATVDFVAVRGPNSSSTRASLPFFVSVVGPNDEVISKKTYEVPVDFENGAHEARFSSPIEAQYGLKSGEDGATYRVLVGFHLNPAQVDANTRFFNQMPSSGR